jgi:pimeloyl-ACP methyl ester carboxylesterase
MTLDGLIQSLSPWLGEQETSEAHEAAVAVLNGIVGDHLEATQNPLALPMRFRRAGIPLRLTPEGLRQAYPDARGKLLILVHGLCMNDLLWTRNGHNHGLVLAQDLDMSSIFLHYNSGLHISTNGERFSALLESLVAQWPEKLEEVVILGYSMGGLVTRSAYEAAKRAGHTWPRFLKRWVFLGTPHHGSPLERGGNQIDWILEKSPYAAHFSRLGKIRSAGITDLRHGSLVSRHRTICVPRSLCLRMLRALRLRAS